MDAGYPFTLLRVDADTDEKTLKRAYAALVREHRPDRDPTAFARIHAAYEAALTIRNAQGWSSEPSETRAHLALFQEGPLERSPKRASAEPSRVAIEPGGALDVEPGGALDVEPEAGSKSAVDLDFAPPLTLEELVGRVGEEHAALLVNEATDRLLLAGHADYLLRELLSKTADRLLLLEPSIEPALLKTSAVLAYSGPHEAGALLDRVDLGGESWLEDRALLAQSFADAFEKAGGRQLPPELFRLVTLLPVVDEPHNLTLLQDALSYARRQPVDFQRSLDGLPLGLLEAIGLQAFAGDDDDERPNGSTGPSEQSLQDLLRQVNRQVDEDRDNSRWTLALVLTLAVGVGLWLWLGWIGAAVGGVLLALAVGLPMNSMDARLYSTYVRPPLLSFTLQTGASPDHLLLALKKFPLTSDIRRFTDEVRGDALLTLAHRLVAGARRHRFRGAG